MLMLLVFIRLNGDASTFIAQVKERDAVAAFGGASWSEAEKRELYNKIVAESELRAIPPVNARIDRVWRAIPGYNGLAVDIERTYEAALRAPRGAIPYRYKEIEPSVKLEQLGPQPIYRGNPDKKMVSFMVNVAWGNEYLEPILSTFKRENVKATFFLDGTWLKNNKELAARIAEEGHELSNHAYSHPDMASLTRAQQYAQISKTEELLKAMNVANKWFAPPSGSYNAATVQVAREQGLMTVLWTIDTVDWRNPPAEGVIRKIDAKLHPGALILMHPTATSRDALAGMIASAKAKGYAIGTVSETLSPARLPEPVEGAAAF
jgi:Predicted xylanase/chitin deacetylase